MSLSTTWLKIATSGATADQRSIPKDWIDEMADSYDTTEYTALLWFNHNHDWGDDGKVLALKAETDKKGRRALFAKLKPSNYLQRMSQYQTLFTSIEPSKSNFAGSGKRYLLGLGITDHPASLGTTQLQFSADNNSEGITSKWTEFDLDLATSDADAPHWFTHFFQKNKQEQDEVMSPEQFREMKTLLKALPGAFAKKVDSSLEERFKQNSNDEVTQLKTELNDLKQKFSKYKTDNSKGNKAETKALKKQVKMMEGKFKKLENKGFGTTKTPEFEAETNGDDLP